MNTIFECIHFFMSSFSKTPVSREYVSYTINTIVDGVSRVDIMWVPWLTLCGGLGGQYVGVWVGSRVEINNETRCRAKVVIKEYPFK